jgi:signal transduction histidine kinase
MRRLYLQVYLACVGIIALFGLLVAAAWHLNGPGSQIRPTFGAAAALLGEVLPGPGEPENRLRETLARLRGRFSADLAVYAPDGALLAASGDPGPGPGPGWTESRWIHSFRYGPAMALRLPDGRWFVARPPRARHGLHLLTVVGLLAATIAAGAYPVARRITRRLERLQERVEALGAGDLAARVEVEGSDEVATLARSFNRAADRIERLVKGQRAVLAGASHELRSPLARIRVALELLATENRPELRDRIAQEIAELDDLIGELLLASRLETIGGPERTEEVDLLGLLAEEAARLDAQAAGEPVRIQGDPRMLRRLVRNLLENARRHAGASAIEASVAPLPGGGARIHVADRGPGVPESERDRIFEPFYRASRAASGGEEGAGLGLALVRQIARHHGGEARCLCREGGGTCFEVDLRGGGPTSP